MLLNEDWCLVWRMWTTSNRSTACFGCHANRDAWPFEFSKSVCCAVWPRRPGKSGQHRRFDRAGPENLGSTRARQVSMPFPNKFSVGFSYKHPDGNLTRIVQQLSVPAPFENKSESMAHQQNKFVGLWCVVRQAQMQSWFWRHFCFHVLSSR